MAKIYEGRCIKYSVLEKSLFAVRHYVDFARDVSTCQDDSKSLSTCVLDDPGEVLSLPAIDFKSL